MKPAQERKKKKQQQNRFRLRTHIFVRYLAFVFEQLRIFKCVEMRDGDDVSGFTKTKNEILFFFFFCSSENEKNTDLRHRVENIWCRVSVEFIR